MNPRTYLIVLSVFISVYAYAQDCACCSEAHQQFDFWVGDWVVYDTAGNVVGENTIEKLENNCIINEYWRGAKGLTGRSYNYYNQSDSTWNQLWIDSNGSNLVLKGRAEPGKMVMKSELMNGQKIDWYYNQITWSQNQNGSVTQHWEILDENENVLSTAFLGIYKRK